MSNPFNNRTASIQGPAHDMVPVTPNNGTDLAQVAIALYVETGGTLVIDTVAGQTRTINVADFSILPLGTRRVRSTGTTAAGIHALVLA
jgi:hypothetical protein